MLSPSLLDLLRVWWKAARPRGWLFPGRDPAQPLTTRQLNRACHAAAQMAEIHQRVSLHTISRSSSRRSGHPADGHVSRPALEVADIFRSHGRHGAKPMPAMSASTS